MKSLRRSTDLRAAFFLENIFLLYLSACAKAQSVSFQQIVPENSTVCPGQLLVYICTTNSSALDWRVPEKDSALFQTTMPNVNKTEIREPFIFELVGIISDDNILTSTATIQMVNSSLDGLEITCSNGLPGVAPFTLSVDVADGPESCSNLSVDYGVIANTSGIPVTEVDVEIRISTNRSFMCAVEYLIQLEGQSKTVPIGSPSINFTVECAEEKYSLDMVIFTLDNESRPGDNPCTFSIPGPPAVENVTVIRCDPDSVVIGWEASAIAGSLSDGTILEYRIHYHLGDLISQHETKNPLIELRFEIELLGNPLQVNITPVLVDIELIGTPLSTSLEKEVAFCLWANGFQTTTATSTCMCTTATTTATITITTTTTTTTTVSPEGYVDWKAPQLIILVVFVGAVALTCIGAMVVFLLVKYLRKNKKSGGKGDPSAKEQGLNSEDPTELKKRAGTEPTEPTECGQGSDL